MIKIYKCGEVSPNAIFARNNPTASVSGVVSEIIADVEKNGDKALYAYAEKFDGVTLNRLEVTQEEIDLAFANADETFVEIVKEAAENIRLFHERQKREGFSIQKADGVVIGQKITPIERVGLYVPGGTAAYPSTVLMDAIPAKIAGCEQLIMVTPPSKTGGVNEKILIAAKLAGVDKIFKIGGAQAVAALACGTESVPKVDKIVGPGNAFVAEAKKQVFGRVSIDMIAGPSEILIVADNQNNPAHIATDLLSQAEHDKMASAVLVTDDLAFAEAVSAELETQIPQLARAEIARASIDNHGKIIVAEDLKEAIAIANEIAPEHLELCVDEPFAYLDEIKHAGSIFMGRFCPEALGDYFAGPNHTLPTSGTARFSSPLSVDDFIKKSQFCYYTETALEKAAKKVAYFAEVEGLGAHAKSAICRVNEAKHSEAKNEEK